MKQHPLQQINFQDSNKAYVIEASAGTGKTWTIERLYIKALLEGYLATDHTLPVGVENILVVTFTNDATDELKERISEQIQTTINLLIYLLNHTEITLGDDLFLHYLYQRKQDYDIRKDITLLTRAVQNFDSAVIFTIHGFCNRVLQDYQFECKSPAGFELMPSKQAIIKELVRDFLRKHIFTNPLFADNLAVVESNLASLFTSMNREHDLIERITDKIPNDLLHIEDNNYTVKYSYSYRGELTLLNNPELLEDDKRIAKAEFLAAIIAYIAHHYSEYSAKLNAISYDELIQKVADSIKNTPLLAEKLYQKYPLAFIDEFQDTDSLQWQIFSSIYQLTSAKRGTVVVVGDPKQAIYRFRGADVDTYLQAREQIANCLELTDNYRSHPAIMNFVNMLFALPNQNAQVATSFLGNGIDYTNVAALGKSKLVLPAAAKLTQKLATLGLQHEFYDEPVQLVAITGNSAAERKTRLLYAMTLEIMSLLAQDSSLKGKIAIIVTKNREASEVVNFLRKFGIKAAELKLGNIFATATAQDLYQILLAAQDLSVRKNLLQALGTQLFNLPLAQLVVDENGNSQVLERWYKKLFEYNQIWQRRGIISVVYKILEDVIAEHNGASAVLSNRELANLNQLAELLNKQMRSLHNQSELMHWYKTKLDNADEQLANDLDGSNEELVRLDNDDEQIIITTQHKSKGLEYEVLFCPYFKSGIQLDGQYDFNYRRPFFSSYRDNGQAKSVMLMDKALGEVIVNNDNKEIHRLNYVALTRAKSRIYIYLKQPTISKTTGKYFALQRPDKLVELFGFVADDPNDDSHALFNYPQFFGPTPLAALKRPLEMSGVTVYQRQNITVEQLQLISRQIVNTTHEQFTNYNTVNESFNPVANFARQSYSAIASHGHDDSANDWFVKNELKSSDKVIEYRYAILNDPEFKGAVFGVLFHALCEAYPFSSEALAAELTKANVKLSEPSYLNELAEMLDITFNYHLFNGYTLNTLPDKLHELEFNLHVQDEVVLARDLHAILAKHLGAEHSFTQACQLLDKIETGFLVGFIDLFFAMDGKYWVLDYKTNKLSNYQAVQVADDDGEIIASMSEHHYYLQYLLYLVAIKRYLEMRLNILDASELIGGAIYFYVRGAFTSNVVAGDGVFVDATCQQIVREIDLVMRGERNE